VHYFAVSSLEEGRLWMAALMKATIDRDESAEVKTTYQQKTISLASARARKERPPALRGVSEDGVAPASSGAQESKDEEPVSPVNAGQFSDLATVPEAVSPVSQTTRSPKLLPFISDQRMGRDVTILDIGRNDDSNKQLQKAASLSSVKSGDSKSVTSTRKSASSSQGHGQGLGINGLNNGSSSGSPIINRMQNAGLW